MTQIRTILVSGSVPTTNQLALGDIAINTVDGKAYIKKYSGSVETVIEIGAGITPISASYAITASYAQTATTASYFSGSISNAISASYAATASYATNFKVSGSITDVDYIDFDTTASVIQPSLARLSWNQTDKTLDLGTGDGDTTLQIGQETVYPPVVNKDSIDLGEGTLVMVDPTDIAQGNRIRVVRAVTDGTYPSQYIVGVLTEDIAKNQEGFATWFGYVRNLNIPTLESSSIKPSGESWVEGNVLFANPAVPGGLTYTQPAAPAVDATIAVITAINGNNLTLLVRPTLTITVGELNNVADTTTTGSYGDLFIKSGSVWTTGRQLTGSYGLTGSLNVIGSILATSFTGSLTGSLFGTASNALTASYLNPLAQTVRLTGSLIITGSVLISSSATFINVGPAVFTGSAGTGSAVTVYKSGSTAFDIQGSSGQLFAVTDSLTGSLFSVNTAAGLPVVEAFSDNTVNIGKFGTYPIKVAATGTLAIITGSFTGSFTGSATTAVTASYALTSSFPWFQTGSNITYVGGNVGIGTPIPTLKLDVAGAARFETNTYINVAATTNSGLTLINSVTGSAFAKFGYIGGGTNDSFIGSITNNNFSIRSANADRITVLNTGLVGINTASPTAQLQVKGTGTSAATTALRVENSSAAARLTISDIGDTAFNTSHLYISSSGAVGISTVAPAYTLEVNGPIYSSPGQLLLTTSGSVNKEGAFIASSTGRTLQMGIFDNSVVPVGIDMFETNNSFPSTYLNFRVNNANLVRMTGSFVGIGTTSPITTLDVSGSGKFTDGLTVTGSTIAKGDFTVTGATTTDINTSTLNINAALFTVPSFATPYSPSATVRVVMYDAVSNALFVTASTAPSPVIVNTIATGSITASVQIGPAAVVPYFFLVQSGSVEMLKINAERVMVLEARTTVPTAVTGGIYYSASGDFYFGM